MNRKEHLEWAKKRANEYLDRDDPVNGLNSMLSDLSKHAELRDHIALALVGDLMMIGQLRTVEQVRKFVDGFN